MDYVDVYLHKLIFKAALSGGPTEDTLKTAETSYNETLIFILQI